PRRPPWRRARPQADRTRMTFATAIGVHLLPSTGEGAYDTLPMVAWERGPSGLENGTNLNTLSAPGRSKTDLDYPLDQLQAQHPECTTVSVVSAWFFDSEDAALCHVYPSTNYLLGAVEIQVGGVFIPTHWMVSGLTEQHYPGLIPIPKIGDSFVY